MVLRFGLCAASVYIKQVLLSFSFNQCSISDVSPICVLVMPLVTPLASYAVAVGVSPSHAFPTLFLAFPPTPTHRSPHTSITLLRRYPVQTIGVL